MVWCYDRLLRQIMISPPYCIWLSILANISRVCPSLLLFGFYSVPHQDSISIVFCHTIERGVMI